MLQACLGSSVGCAFLRMDGTLVETNAAFYDLLGMGQQEVVGRTIFTICATECMGAFMTSWCELLFKSREGGAARPSASNETHVMVHCVVSLVHATGKLLPCQLTMSVGQLQRSEVVVVHVQPIGVDAFGRTLPKEPRFTAVIDSPTEVTGLRPEAAVQQWSQPMHSQHEPVMQPRSMELPSMQSPLCGVESQVGNMGGAPNHAAVSRNCAVNMGQQPDEHRLATPYHGTMTACWQGAPGSHPQHIPQPAGLMQQAVHSQGLAPANDLGASVSYGHMPHTAAAMQRYAPHDPYANRPQQMSAHEPGSGHMHSRGLNDSLLHGSVAGSQQAQQTNDDQSFDRLLQQQLQQPLGFDDDWITDWPAGGVELLESAGQGASIMQTGRRSLEVDVAGWQQPGAPPPLEEHGFPLGTLDDLLGFDM